MRFREGFLNHLREWAEAEETQVLFCPWCFEVESKHTKTCIALQTPDPSNGLVPLPKRAIKQIRQGKSPDSVYRENTT